MERLMACWSHVALAQAESPDVLSSDMKRDKNDIEVVQRLRILQETCITSSEGNCFMQTGDETTKTVTEEINFRGHPADKRDAAELRKKLERESGKRRTREDLTSNRLPRPFNLLASRVP
jgi:hypothetical protein